MPRVDELVKLYLYFSNKDIISLSAHNHSVVVSYQDFEDIVPKTFSVQKEKPNKHEEVAALVEGRRAPSSLP